MKIIKIFLLVIACGVMFFLLKISKENKIATLVRNNEDIRIMVVGADDNEKGVEFDGLYIMNYVPSKKSTTVFPITSLVRYVKKGANKPIYLRRIFYKIYRRNKKDMDKTLVEFKEKIEEIYDINIPFYMHVNREVIKDLNNLLGTGLEYDKLFADSATDLTIAEKFSNLEHCFTRIEILKFIFKLRSFKRNIFSMLNTNLSMFDIFCILVSTESFGELDFILVGSENILRDDDVSYMKKYINIQDISPTHNITAEVLNASGRANFALHTTRSLRDNGIDVLRWGNYRNLSLKTMVIDRVGNWNNAKTILDILQTGVIFTKRSDSRFVDVSVILGE